MLLISVSYLILQVATPGRLMDHLTNTKGFSLRTLKYLVWLFAMCIYFCFLIILLPLENIGNAAYGIIFPS